MDPTTYLWFKPAVARTWHIFKATGRRSLCSGWACFGRPGSDQAVEPDKLVKLSPGDCRRCVAVFNKAVVCGQPAGGGEEE